MKDLHGTVTGYKYGCRCERCRLANTMAMREYRAGKKPRMSARQQFLAELAQKPEYLESKGVK